MRRLGCWSSLLALMLGCSAPGAGNASPLVDAGHDSSGDSSSDSSTPSDGDGIDTSTLPPPIEDASDPDFGAPPAPGTHIEATIGPAGGHLEGDVGTPLAAVALDVPAGALAAPTLIAIDLDVAPTLPSGSDALSPYVRVGPDGTAFAAPARLSLPCSPFDATTSITGFARVGASWSSLLAPSYDASAARLEVSMSRASGAIAATIHAAVSPTIADFAPMTATVGDVVFIDGSGFGDSPAWLSDPSSDAGAARVSSVDVGGVVAEVIGWSDGAISFRVPAGATTAPVRVRTTATDATSATSLTIH